ncbi:MAG: putative peptidoglycan glycosyltransferase FtsW [Candidatus Paceibacterota bacterium]|jgi:cell division protein FtsW
MKKIIERKKIVEIKHQPDFILLGTFVLLILIGILVLATASTPYSLRMTDSPNYFLFKQLAAIFIGSILGFIVYKIPLETVKKYGSWAFFGALALMFLVFFPVFGNEVNGATRWIKIGGLSILQPAELLKITAIIYLANLVSKLNKKKSFWPFAGIVGTIALSLLLQKDLSTLIILCSAAGVIYFCGNASLKNIFLLFAAGVIAVGAFIMIEPYRVQRIQNLFNSSRDLLGAGYHPQQALISIGSGQMFGSGLGLSVQKFGFLPESITDSIFAIFAEETGFIGCILLLGLFMFFAFRVFSLGKKVNDAPCKLISYGIGFWIIAQTLVNMASMTGMIPVSGVPMPFISYGGSHIISEFIAVGVLLNISKKA